MSHRGRRGAARKAYYDAVTTENLVRMRELDLRAAEVQERRRVLGNQMMAAQMRQLERQELLREQVAAARSHI